MAVKVLDADGSGDCNDIALGIKFAANHGARVINLSLGPDTLGSVLGSECVDILQNAAAYAFGKGDFVSLAAGNSSLQTVYASHAVEVVGATGPDDEPAYYSSTGADVYAPGGDDLISCSTATCIYSTWLNGGYHNLEGTSQATPYVSGLAALLMSMGLTNKQVIGRINSTSDNVGGLLRVNAARAVGPPPAPTASATHALASPSTSSSPTLAATSKAATASPKPTPKKPKVLAVGPSKKPAATTEAAGARKTPSTSSRALPIGIAIGLLGCLFLAVVVGRRVRASRSA
jgi:hypothetical protein